MRNRPCPCGSGRAARDCCGRFKRLPESEVARAYLHRQARMARELLAPFSPSGLNGLLGELSALPAARELLVGVLFGPNTPQIARLATAAARRPEHDIDRFVSAMTTRVDTPLARAALAKAIVALRAEGAVDEHLAAAALLDLDSPESKLFDAALAVAVDRAVRGGEPAAVLAGHGRHHVHA